MSIEKHKKVVFLFLIAGRKLKEPLLNFLSNGNAKVVNTSYGKGSANAKPSLVEAFGFVPEENKVMITCLLSRSDADVVLEKLVRKFNFDKPNTGIAFTVPVDSLAF